MTIGVTPPAGTPAAGVPAGGGEWRHWCVVTGKAFFFYILGKA